MVRRSKRSKTLKDIAVGYLRVSTDDQANGLAAQRSAIERWASGAGVTVIEFFVDDGVSGGTPVDERPGLSAALIALEAHAAGLLLVAKRDRIARDVMVAAVTEKLVTNAGARIVTADGAASDDSAEGALMRTLLDAFAAYERAQIRARTRNALAAKKARGELTGRAPFGFAAQSDGKTTRLVRDDHEQAAVQRMRELRATGATQSAIAAALTLEGYRPRGTKWNVTTVARALSR